MPVTLTDEQIQTIAEALSRGFCEALQADEVDPPTWISQIESSLPFLGGQFAARVREHWLTRNQEKPESRRRPLEQPLVLLGGYGEGAPEERVRALIPEEKIFINRKVFHDILDGVDFTKLDPVQEKRLLGTLKTESIGLSDQEALLYFTLIKLSRSPMVPEKSVSPTLPPKEASLVVLERLIKQFGDLGRLTAFNENREIPLASFQDLFSRKLSARKPSAAVAFFLCGAWPRNPHPVLLVRSFLQQMSEKWGADTADCLLLYEALFLLGGLDPAVSGVSRALAAFLRGESTRLVKPVMSISIHFIHAFSQTLALQVVEINRKYSCAPPDQQPKLVKLYAAPERRSLLIANAAANGFQAVSYAKSESLEITKIWRAFAPKLSAFLTPEDLFATDYGQTPPRESP
ncbi:MAG: hypothetical protein J0L75_01575 [Spirochaetes bacterium]|nr:hypothetical protein [Spirochaetota bacterium]